MIFSDGVDMTWETSRQEPLPDPTGATGGVEEDAESDLKTHGSPSGRSVRFHWIKDYSIYRTQQGGE